MIIKAFHHVDGIISKYNFFEESRHIDGEEELRWAVKALLSAMKKSGDVSFNLCRSASSSYVVVSGYDQDSEAFLCQWWNNWRDCDKPCQKSSKNLLAWALEMYRADVAAT